jgi:hypothetical protein
MDLKVRLLGLTNLPPFAPARLARSWFFENVLFSDLTDLPPLLAISRRFSGVMDANPRLPDETNFQFDSSVIS